MADPDPYVGWSLSDRLQMLAFEAELAHVTRSLITAIWEALDSLDSLDSQRSSICGVAAADARSVRRH